MAAILEPYNNDLTLTADEDAAFARAGARTHGTASAAEYVWLPLARAVTMWFTPRIELIPVSGTVFPLVQSWQDDKVDQSVTVGFFLLNIAYVVWRLRARCDVWKASNAVRPAVGVLVVFMVLRTAFLTTFETPEPRYVLVCFPSCSR